MSNKKKGRRELQVWRRREEGRRRKRAEKRKAGTRVWTPVAKPMEARQL